MQFTESQRTTFRAQMQARTAARAARVAEQARIQSCPLCGSPLGSVLQYLGGRGYMPFDVCTFTLCTFIKRAW